MEDVEITGTKGDDIARNAPHARFDCLIHQMDKTSPDPRTAKDYCPNCYCWVCDVKASECKDWQNHCLCNGSVEWAQQRAKMQRMKKADGANPQAQPSQEEVNRRFAQATAAASVPLSAQEEEARDAREQAAQDEENEELFTEYEPLHFKAGQPHPDPVVETTSLSFAELPPNTYQLALPKEIFEARSEDNPLGGALSRLQLETVAYANQRHALTLPSGERAGFFLGDGVGLGKGRQLAGIIYENWRNGRKRHLWVSVSADLMVDAQRDLADIGAGEIPVHNITKLPYGKLETAGKVKQGVIFSTYSALVANSVKGKRLDQIATWLGRNSADGCIMFDESHKAKNLFPESADPDTAGTSGAGKKPRKPAKGKQSTKMALAVKEVQSLCPAARVVYCSATGASSLPNMAYMERLGLWGTGTAFADFGAFEKSMEHGGVGAMELIALDLKRRGMYISRQLSFKSAEFETVVHDLTSRQRGMYDAAAQFWAELLGCFTYALHDVLKVKGVKRHPSGRVMTHYWGCHQRFFRSMCMAMKVPLVAETTKRALAENKCVVIGLQTTGESRLNDAVKAEQDLDEFAGMKEVVKFLISKFPTGDYLEKHPEEEDDDSDEADDDLIGQSARAGSSRISGDTRSKVAMGGERDDSSDEEDDDLGGFIVRSDEEESGSDDDMELEGDRKVTLPDAVKSLSKGQLRELLRLAKIPDQQCTERAQLLSRLKQVEARAASGAGPTVDALLKKTSFAASAGGGSSTSPGASGNKRGSPEEEGGRRPKRLQRNVSYVEGDGDGDDVEMEEEEEEEETSDNALLQRRVRVRGSIGTVVAHDRRSGKHTVQLDGGDEICVDLQREKWDLQAAQRAPGLEGSKRSRGGRRVVVSDDDAGSDGEENAGPQRSRPSRASRGKSKPKMSAKAKGKRRAADDSDSASDWEDEDESEEEEEEEGDESDWSGGSDAGPAKAKGGKRGGRAAAKPKPKPKPKAKPKAAAKGKVAKRKGGRDDDDDDDDDDDVDSLLGGDDDLDEQDNLAQFQHHNVNEIKHLQELKRQLLRKLTKLEMPDNPLDKLISELGGPEMVSELTGRKGRLVRDEEGKTVYKKRNAGEKDSEGRSVAMERINLQEKDNFMSGKKLVAIISEAASSGISLQADRRVKNTRRRVHITLELPWSADQCIQQCGRTHRSNQIHGPQYMLMMTACGGERRFASTVAKRLQALGALTKGDRRAADASDLSAFDVDTKWGRKAMEDLVEVVMHPAQSRIVPPPSHIRDALGLKANSELQERWTAYLDDAEDALAGAGIDNETGGVKKFLNRLLGMPVGMQNKIFAHFSANLDDQVKRAKDNNQYDDGVVDIRGNAVRIEVGYPQTLETDKQSGVPLQHFKIGVDRGIDIEHATGLLDAKAKENEAGKLYRNEGFYISNRAVIGREKEGVKAYALLVQKPIPTFAINPIPLYKCYRPGTGLGQTVSFAEFTEGGRFKKLDDPDDATKGWTRLFKDALTICSHGPNCKHGSLCKVGRRVENKHVLCGSVLPFWDKISSVVGFETQGDRGDRVKLVSRMKIVRVRIDKQGGGETRLVGVEIAEQNIAKLNKLLNNAAAAGSSSDVKPDIKPDIKPKMKKQGGLTIGSNVQVQGLTGATQYNGRRGTVTGYDAQLGRFEVTLAGGKYEALKAKPANLIKLGR